MVVRLDRLTIAAGIAACVWLVLAPVPAAAHDVPGQMVVQSFAKPEGQRLHVVARLPLILLQGFGLPKRGPGYLDLGRLDDRLDTAAAAVADELRWFEDGRRLVPETIEARISKPSERVFESFERALAHVTGPPLPRDANVFWNQGFFDLHLAYPIRDQASRFALDAGLDAAGPLELNVRFVPPDGGIRAYRVHGGHGLLELDPSWYRAAWTFVPLGFEHILEGIDHVLFLLCLVLPFGPRHLWPLVAVITSFTVAHSITLIAAATGLVPAGAWFPPLVETMIALSIVYMALDNVIGAWLGGDAARTLRWRWLIAGAFGLIHGFGFSFVLAEELQFAGDHLLVSLLAFNLGVELGQLAILLVALPLLGIVLRHARARKIGVIIGSALLGHTGWHWMLERMAELRYLDWPDWQMAWPVILVLALPFGLLAAAVGRQARQSPVHFRGSD